MPFKILQLITEVITYMIINILGHGSDNVTIISTELSLGHGTKITPTENNKELLSK